MNNIMFLDTVQMNDRNSFTLTYRVPRNNTVSIAHNIKSGRKTMTGKVHTVRNEKLISDHARTRFDVVTEDVSFDRLRVVKNLVEATGRELSRFDSIGVARVA